MAENDKTLEATEPTVTDNPELDQPEDDAVSLADVLGEADEAEGNGAGEQQTGAEEAGTADRQPEEPANGTKPLTQADFDKAFGERTAGLRKQWEREHSDELRLAALLAETYPGMSADEIEDALVNVQARALAEQTGWDEEEAVKKVQARRRFERTGRVEEPPADAHVTLLQTQLREIREREKVDMLPIIQNDAYLAEQVDTGAMDVKDAYAHYLKNQMAPGAASRIFDSSRQRSALGPTWDPSGVPTLPKKRAAPVTPRGGATGGLNGPRELSDADVKRIDEQLKAGRRVRLD